MSLSGLRIGRFKKIVLFGTVLPVHKIRMHLLIGQAFLQTMDQQSPDLRDGQEAAFHEGCTDQVMFRYGYNSRYTKNQKDKAKALHTETGFLSRLLLTGTDRSW
jgi:hypothetical protein